jgi:CBS domain-containing protein
MIEGRERHLMERVVVTRGMVAEFPKLELPSDMEALRRLARETDADTVVVVDEEGRLAGTIRLGVLAESGVQDMRELEQLIEGSPITVLPTETLDQVLGKMALRGIRVLPVIDSRSSGRVIGIVTRESVLSAYWNALAAETQSSED